MTIAFVAEKNADGGFGASTSMPYVSQAGNTLILFVSSNGDNTVTDSAGNVWTLIADTTTAGATSQRVGQAYICINAKAITSVTITRATSSNWSVKMTEWSGVNALEGSAVSVAPTAVSVNGIKEGLVLIVAFHFSGTATVPAGFTALDTTNQRLNFNISVNYRVPTLSQGVSSSLGFSAAGLMAIALSTVIPVAPPVFHILRASGWKPASLSYLRS